MITKAPGEARIPPRLVLGRLDGGPFAPSLAGRWDSRQPQPRAASLPWHREMPGYLRPWHRKAALWGRVFTVQECSGLPASGERRKVLELWGRGEREPGHGGCCPGLRADRVFEESILISLWQTWVFCIFLLILCFSRVWCERLCGDWERWLAGGGRGGAASLRFRLLLWERKG